MNRKRYEEEWMAAGDQNEEPPPSLTNRLLWATILVLTSVFFGIVLFYGAS